MAPLECERAAAAFYSLNKAEERSRAARSDVKRRKRFYACNVEYL